MKQETAGKHTATPWQCNGELIFHQRNPGGRKTYVGIISFEVPAEMAKANAQFIVLACNHHEELVEALRDVSNAASYINDANRAGIEINSQDWSVLHDRTQRAKTILSKIQGTK